MERITGNGAPTRTTVGVVGQHYEDLNTGNIYECLVASEHSKIHGPMMGGYIWKLKVTGEDLEDHAAIFGGGSGGSGGNIFPVVINISYDDSGAVVYSCDKTAIDIYEATSQRKMPVLYVYEDGRCINYSPIYTEYYNVYYNEAGESVEEVGVQFITFANYPQGGFPISYAILFDGTVKDDANMGTERLRITGNDGFFMQSSTPESKKMFRIEVDDSGSLTATEVT